MMKPLQRGVCIKQCALLSDIDRLFLRGWYTKLYAPLEVLGRKIFQNFSARRYRGNTKNMFVTAKIYIITAPNF